LFYPYAEECVVLAAWVNFFSGLKACSSMSYRTLCSDQFHRGNLIYVYCIFLVPDPGKGVCTDPVNGGAILGKGGTGSPRREQGASVEPR
jgi:hypothetical protein